MSNYQGTLPKPYISPQGRAKKATIALWIIGAIALISIWSAFSEIQLAKNIANGVSISETQVTANDTRQTLISVIYFICFICFICFIVTAILFLRWEVLAYANLYDLATGNTRITTTWIVLNWLIPFISLYRPYLDMKELWTKSHPDSKESDSKENKDSRMSKLIGPWWLTWLAGSVPSTYLLFSLLKESSTPEDLIQLNYISIVGDIFLIAALPMIILLIKQITTNQEIKSRHPANPFPRAQPQRERGFDPATYARLSGRSRTRQPNDHDNVPLNPYLSGLKAHITRADLTGQHSGPIQSFSSYQNDEEITLSVEYQHRNPVQTPVELEFRFIDVTEDNALYMEDTVILTAESGSTGYTGIGIHFWTPLIPRPKPGGYTVKGAEIMGHWGGVIVYHCRDD